MLKKLSLTLATFGLAITFFASVQPAHALFSGAKEEACKGASLGDTPDCGDTAVSDSSKLIQTIINLLSTIVGIIAVVMIIVNGLRMITSSGDANSVSSARNGVIYAIVGLILVALSQVIVRFVLDKTG